MRCKTRTSVSFSFDIFKPYIETEEHKLKCFYNI